MLNLNVVEWRKRSSLSTLVPTVAAAVMVVGMLVLLEPAAHTWHTLSADERIMACIRKMKTNGALVCLFPLSQ